MTRSTAVLLLSAAALFAREPSDAEVRRVHRSALLVDTHNDVPIRVRTGFDIGMRAERGHTDLPRLREGGVGAVFFAVWVPPALVKEHACAHRALEMFDAVRHGIIDRYPKDFTLALTADDIVAARRKGRIAALIGVEGGHAIEDSLALLRQYYRLGARYMTLTHVNTNEWADSSNDKPVHHGLTEFGKQVIAEMNRLGMIVDVSHASDEVFRDVLEISRAPVFASHSGCRSLCDDPRNLTDDMIRALGEKGGVVQINFYSAYLTKRTSPQAGIEDVVAHIEHVVKLAGIDAVGIGSDFDGITKPPVGLEDVSKFPNLTRALLSHGYSEGDIRKIYGGNTLRLMRGVERAAGERID